MNIINYLGGLKTALALTGTIVATSIVPNVLKAIKGFTGLNTILKTLRTTAMSTTTFLQGLTLGVGLIITGLLAVQNELDENLKKLTEDLEEYNKKNKETEQNLAILKDENATREDLAKVISSVIEGYDAEGKSIDELNKKRQEAIDLLNEEKESSANEILSKGYDQYVRDLNALSGKGIDFQTRNSELGARVLGIDLEQYLALLKETRSELQKEGLGTEYLTQEIEELEQKITEAKGRIANYQQALEATHYTYDETTHRLIPLNETVESINLSQEEFNDLYDRGKEVLEEYKDIPYEAQKALDAQNKSQEDVLGSLEALSEMTGLSTDQISEYMDSLDENAYSTFISDTNTAYGMLMTYKEGLENTEEAQKAFNEQLENATSPLKNAESAYKTLQTAVNEFSETGGLSAETIKQLSQLDENWISLLEEVDGKLQINEIALASLAEQTRDQAIADLQAQASQDMLNVALGDLANISPIAKDAISDLSKKNSEEAQTALEASQAEILHATAIEAINQALGQGGNTQQAIDNISAIEERYKQLINNMSSWTIKSSSSSSGSGKSSKSKETDKYLEAFKKEKEALKHQLEMDYISEKEYYDSLQELNERYFGIATGLHQKYLEQYTENEEEVYKGLKSIYDQAKDYLAEAVEESYQDAINILEKEEKTVLANIKKQIDAVKKEQEGTLDGIHSQIDSVKKEQEEILKGTRNQIETLKDEKSTVEDYWNDQINAIKEANEEIEKQTELLKLQQALAEAKAKKVMVMGENGQFGLGENENAIATAEKNLSDYQDKLSSEQQIEDMEKMRDAQLDNLQARIDDLENYYDYMKDYYDNQIDSLQEYYDRTKDYYDNQIDSLQEYYDKTQEVYDNQKQALQDQLDAFKDSQKEYENIQNAKLAQQVMAMDAEAENWNKELANLRNYINQYNAMLTQLGTAGKYVGYSYEAGKGINPTPVPVGGGVPKHASGVASVANDEIALVGEGKNAELVIGAKRNQGALMSLPKGSGVVNAESTQTLAGVLNSLASPKRNNSNMNGVTQTFTFGNISLPNVTDANSFVKELSNKFNNYAIQYSSIRE